MQKGIAFAGNMIVDQLKFVDRYPEPHTLASIGRVGRSMGGLACNCTADAARLDPTLPITAIGVVGEDAMGDYIVQQLAAYPNVDTGRIVRQGETSFTDVMTAPDGGRTFFQYRGANALLGPEHFDLASLDAGILHIGYMLLLDRLDAADTEYPTTLCRLLAGAQALGIQTSVDTVSDSAGRFAGVVRPALRYADYCIINELEAQNTTGIVLRDENGIRQAALQPCLEQLASLGVSRWAVLHAPELACGLDVVSGRFYLQRSVRLPEGFIRSTVGAGDAFATAILLSAWYGWPLNRALETAAAVAAYSLGADGASGALKPLEEILTDIQKLEVKQNETL